MRRLFIVPPLLGVTIVSALSLPIEASANCFNACSNRYNSCVHGFNQRDCATQRSICTNKCAVGNSESRRYGAIAYSRSTGAFGTSRQHRSRRIAERVAIQACRSRKADDCTASVFFFNRCGALAKSFDGAYGTAHGRTAAIAQVRAHLHCSKFAKFACKTIATVCSR